MSNSMVQTPQPQENRIGPNPAGRGLPASKADIAALSLDDIRQMNSEGLISIIRLAEVGLFRENVLDHLPFFDRTTLEQLAFLAQRTVRNQGY